MSFNFWSVWLSQLVEAPALAAFESWRVSCVVRLFTHAIGELLSDFSEQ